MPFPSWARSFHTELTLPPTHPLRPVNPNNAWDLCVTAAAGTELAVPSSFATINLPSLFSRQPCSRMTGVYGPKPFVPHAASLHQAFAHCERFSTAATRRCLDRVSVPVWLIVLSDQLPVIALVGRYPTNQHDRPQAHPKAPGPCGSPALTIRSCLPTVTFGISPSFDRLFPTLG